jgi:hypothetical protein
MAGPATLSVGIAQAEALLRFNLLPSLSTHPEQLAGRRLPESLRQLLEPGKEAAAARSLHRHWSRLLRREFGDGAIDEAGDPVLAIALLGEDEFNKLALWCGIAVLAPSIRRFISRDEVAALRLGLGEDGLAFARRALLDFPADAAAPLQPAEVGAQAARLGAALLSVAFEGATPEVAWRARLRLPPDAARARQDLPRSLANAATALKLAREVTALLDPAWLSSFPVPR